MLDISKLLILGTRKAPAQNSEATQNGAEFQIRALRERSRMKSSNALRPRPWWRPLYAAGCRRKRMRYARPDRHASRNWCGEELAPPLRLTTFLLAVVRSPPTAGIRPDSRARGNKQKAAHRRVLPLVFFLLSAFALTTLRFACLASSDFISAIFAAAAFRLNFGLDSVAVMIFDWASNAMPLVVSGLIGSLVGLGSSGVGLRRTATGSASKASPFGSSPAPGDGGSSPQPGLPASFQASATAPSSSSFSDSPARIASTISPEFCRTAASILLAMSGFCLRNTLAFSRPWPMR